MSAAPALAAARFAITLDQLHVIESSIAGVLPAEFRTAWGDEVTDAERRERENVALAGLARLGLLEPGTTALGERLHPAIRSYLGLFADPALRIDVRAWGGGRTYVHSVAVLLGFAASLVRTQRLDEHGTTPRNEDLAELSAYEFTDLAAELLRSFRQVDAGLVASTPLSSVVLPLTEAQGLVNAIRSGSDEIVAGALAELGRDGAVLPVARAAAFGIDAGFTVFGRAPATGDEFSAHWFHGDSGWYELAIATPSADEVSTTVEFADRSRVRMTSRSSESIVASIVTAVATLGGAFRG